MNTDTAPIRPLPEALTKLIDACHHDPFEVLGKHFEGREHVLRAYLPHCRSVRVAGTDIKLQRVEGTDLFEWHGNGQDIADRYQLSWIDRDGLEKTAYDPYCFPVQIGDLDLHLFGEGRHLHAYRVLGSHTSAAETTTIAQGRSIGTSNSLEKVRRGTCSRIKAGNET